MKIISAAAVILIFLIVLIFGCTKEDLTGNTVKATVSDSVSNASSSEGVQEGCVIDGGLLDRVFSGHGSL